MIKNGIPSLFLRPRSLHNDLFSHCSVLLQHYDAMMKIEMFVLAKSNLKKPTQSAGTFDANKFLFLQATPTHSKHTHSFEVVIIHSGSNIHNIQSI